MMGASDEKEGRDEENSRQSGLGQPTPQPPAPIQLVATRLSGVFALDGLQNARGKSAGTRPLRPPSQALVQLRLGLPVRLRLGMRRQPGAQLRLLGVGQFPAPA